MRALVRAPGFPIRRESLSRIRAFCGIGPSMHGMLELPDFCTGNNDVLGLPKSCSELRYIADSVPTLLLYSPSPYPPVGARGPFG